jgi:subtilisin family serine protease
MKYALISILFLFCQVKAQSPQTSLYWIILHTPKSQTANLQSRTSAQALGVTERSLQRRAKSLPPDRLIDEYDLPVSESVLAQIKQTGAKIRVVSRWFNAVSVEASPQQRRMIATLPGILHVEPVVQFKSPRPLPSSSSPVSLAKTRGTQGIDYGPSATQLTNMKAVDLHAIGVIGTGVLIAMLDDGFNNYRTHAALKNIRVIGTYDFIHNISDVSIQPWEHVTSPDQGNHGAGALSALGGFDNGQMIGAAFGASFLLAKTEMDSSGDVLDFNSEEDTYVAALEWAERLGADITSSSLGYKEFWSTPTYTTADMNGRTTKVARAAVIAARKGVLVVTAMGNEGYISGYGNQTQRAESTLISPADADSILSVGATSSDGELAVFSSCGPTADGRIKPEVVAQGMGVYWADGSTIAGYSSVSGTSAATPLVAGAAALVLSAHPQLTNMQVRDVLMKTTIQRNDGTSETAVYPNNFYGYGFVDASSAALSLGPVFSNNPLVMKTTSSYRIYIWIKQNVPARMNNVSLYYKRATDVLFKLAEFLPTTNDNEYFVTLPVLELDSTAIGYVTAQDPSGVSWRTPPNGSNHYFSLRSTPDSLIGIFPTPGKPLAPAQETLYQNYPNPFNNTTFINFDVPEPMNITLEVFNLLGQRVKHIFRGMVSSQGTQEWDGTDDFGRQVGSGVYFTRLITPNSVRSIKMLYIK